VLRNIYSKSYIEELRNDYLTRYKEYFKDQEHPDALTVGNKRYMITVPLEGPYNNPHFYANPFLIPILGRILGFNFILGSIGSVASLPGSKAQHIHRDGPHLFDAECEGITPTYAVTAATPLVPLNKATGSTRVYRGTHLTTTALPKKTDVYLDPEADTGSCVIWDYRLFHGGLPNTSDNVRTIMYNVYSRDWFKDNKNYDKQAHLIIEDGEYDKIPDQFRRLVSWTRIPRSGRQS
jgi:ectoine hydroxylase-related dioxygenase (phytanoyl-CoA dioxygenase family)